MEQLKPCPYCGGKAYIDTFSGNWHIEAFHKKDCIVRPNTFLGSSNHSIAKQVKAWNRRVTDAAE